MTRALTKGEILSLTDEIRRLLSAINSGDLQASVAMRHRLEGALTVLQVIQGQSNLNGLDIANDPLL